MAFRTLDEEGVEREAGALLDGAPDVLVELADEEITVPVDPSEFRREVSISFFNFLFGVRRGRIIRNAISEGVQHPRGL